MEFAYSIRDRATRVSESLRHCSNPINDVVESAYSFRDRATRVSEPLRLCTIPRSDVVEFADSIRFRGSRVRRRLRLSVIIDHAALGPPGGLLAERWLQASGGPSHMFC